MPRKKITGVIEAVRYTQEGKIDTVRAYHRRGSVWSDRVIISRSELLQRLAKGENFVTGQRQPYLGSWFETALPVRCRRECITTEGAREDRDLLSGVPIF